MRTIGIVLGALVTALIALLGAFGAGRSRGSRQAQADAAQQRSQEQAEAVSAAAQRRVEATKGASDVQQSVNHLSDNDVDDQLREKWQRPGSD